MPAQSKTLNFYTDIYTTGTVTILTSTSQLSMPAVYKTFSTNNPPYNKLVFNSNPEKGTGYYGISSGLHTVTYSVANSYVGTVTMQASLASDPVDTDWFDIDTTKSSYIYNPTNTTSTVATTFVGNFTWVRARVEIGQGTLLGIKYNY
jgi:hypothetical protein